MAASAAADGFFRGVLYEGCISGHNNEVQRRPYHKNCGCAIHDKPSPSSPSKTTCTHMRGKTRNVSYPLRRAWSESCLVLAAFATNSSPSSSPAAATTLGGNCRSHHRHHQMGLIDLQEED